MGAITHLWQRAMRRVQLHQLRCRQQQLRQYIQALEDGIANDQESLGHLRLQLRLVNVQLDDSMLGPQRPARPEQAPIFRGPL